MKNAETWGILSRTVCQSFVLSLKGLASSPSDFIGGTLTDLGTGKRKETHLDTPAHCSLPSKKLRAAFLTIVIRNEALSECYPGGISAFVQAHRPRCNDKITVTVHMSGCDADPVFRDLEAYGFEFGADFIAMDVASEALGIAMSRDTPKQHDIETRVPWLRCRYTPFGHKGGGIFVWYVDNHSEEDAFLVDALQELDLDPLELGEMSYRIITDHLKEMYENLGHVEAMRKVVDTRVHLKAQAEYLRTLAD